MGIGTPHTVVVVVVVVVTVGIGTPPSVVSNPYIVHCSSVE